MVPALSVVLHDMKALKGTRGRWYFRMTLNKLYNVDKLIVKELQTINK